MRLCVSFLLLSLLSAEAGPLETNLTLKAALDYAAENNPQLQAAFNQWKGAEANIALQKALPDPTLTYGYYFEPVETRTGPQNQRFGLMQKFPGFGKRAALKSIAADQAVKTEMAYRREKLDLDYRVAHAFAELHHLRRSIEITQERIRLVQDLEQVARMRYTAGSSMASVLQAQLELGRLEDRFHSLQDLQLPFEAKLNAALNRPSNALLAIASPLPFQKIEPDAAVLIAQLKESSPELKALAIGIEQGNHRLELARRERLPDFTLGVQYIETGEASAPIVDSGKDPIIGTVGINLPIWFGKNRARVASAAHQKTAAQFLLESREQTLDAEIRQILFDLRDAHRKINLYKDSLIPKATQSLEVNRKGYESGQLEFINLIDAQRMLLEFELAAERALADHLIHRAQLSKLSGIDFLNVDVIAPTDSNLSSSTANEGNTP